MRRRRSKKSRRFSGAFIVGVFLSLTIGTAQGWGATFSPKSVTDPGVSGTREPFTISYASYNFSRKPDPFEPFVEKDLSLKKRKAVKKVKPLSIFPLQRASVNEFRLVGIAGTDQGRTAIVTNARGNFFPLSVGTIIGLNGGQVIGILEDRVIVEERIAAGKGQYKTQLIPLKLQKVE
ncbi:pilus assembly protein PilP [Syntrophus sp. (in: bacteria)]|uniref:pilus assembly protein PilP n=1 Tax=Syntrophus sp. (in: bacteria) TaxID=48412 RepID=UPI00345EDD53